MDLVPPFKVTRKGPNHTKNPLYGTYKQMLQRCYNPKHKYYSYYGGRGIKVCDRWRGPSGFASFLEDMGEKRQGLTLDRTNNDGDYEPSNCRWATRSNQQINRRMSSNNTSDITGVHWFKNANSWSVYIDSNGKRKHIGYFKDKKVAILARRDAELTRLLDNMKNSK